MGILDRLFGRRAKEEAQRTAPTQKKPPVQKPAPVAEKKVEKVKEETVVKAAEEVVKTAAVEAAGDVPPWGAHLQKRLDTYFARLRVDFPDGVVVRLNTGHKKLAERGAELRRLIGYEGRLDEFFALGGFTYKRSTGGRPSLPQEQTASVEDRLREAFPDDVPTVLAVQQADHRLYLDLRAAARKAGCTVGEFLQQFKA